MPQSVVVTTQSSLGAGLARVAAALGGTELVLSGPEAEGRRRALQITVGRYLLPKVSDPTAPLIAVIVGPTGSGKSALVNAMAGRAVAATGPLRPTTRTPIVWSAGDPPGNLIEAFPEAGERATAGLRPPPDGMVIVDSPPPGVATVDSMDLTVTLLEIADICVFVASERRYADAEAWRLLGIATRRRMPTITVLNRLSGDAVAQRLLREDMARHLVRQGLLRRLHPEGVIGIEEAATPAGIESAVLRKELENLADPQARHAIVAEGIESAIAEVQRGLVKVRESVGFERRRHRHLSRLTVDAYDSESAALRSSLARGELAALAAQPKRLAVDLGSVVTRKATGASRRAAAAWDLDSAGRRALEREPGLWTHGPGTPRLAQEAIASWLHGLPDLVKKPSGRRLRRGWRRRVTDWLRRVSLDPSVVPTGRLRRQVARIPGSAEQARLRLGEAVAGVLEADRQRFQAALGDSIPSSVDDRLWLETEADR